jgi:hypothetical protein
LGVEKSKNEVEKSKNGVKKMSKNTISTPSRPDPGPPRYREKFVILIKRHLENLKSDLGIVKKVKIV